MTAALTAATEAVEKKKTPAGRYRSNLSRRAGEIGIQEIDGAMLILDQGEQIRRRAQFQTVRRRVISAKAKRNRRKPSAVPLQMPMKWWRGERPSPPSH